MSSANWFGLVKGYSLLDQRTSRNLSISGVCECPVNLMLGPVFLTPVLDRMSILLQFTLGNNESYYSGMQLTVGPRGQNFRGSGK